MRQDIEFDAEGVTLRGWLYLPDGATGPVPTVVMDHGFSAVKELYLDSYAEVFAAAGLGALVGANRALFDQDRAARYRGEPPGMIPVVDPDPMAVSSLPTPDSWEWFSETGKTRAPSWKNEVTLRTVEMLMEYEPGAYLERISPTPLLMVVAAGDHLTPSDLALEAYQRAREPKRLELLPGGHFDAYVKDFDRASAAAASWFVQHLG